MVRGYGRIRDADSMVSDDDNSEDDIDDTLVMICSSFYLHDNLPQVLMEKSNEVDASV